MALAAEEYSVKSDHSAICTCSGARRRVGAMCTGGSSYFACQWSRPKAKMFAKKVFSCLARLGRPNAAKCFGQSVIDLLRHPVDILFKVI